MATKVKAATSTPVRYHETVLGQCFSELPGLWWEDERKPCVVCKEPTNWRRPRKRGAATHPECEGSVFDTVSELTYAEILFDVASTLGVTEMAELSDEPPTEKPRNNRPLGDPAAGCSICGRGFSALWIVARLWACPLHSLIPIKYPRRWS